MLGLVEIGRKESASDSARVAAWTEVLNRGWGKAPQQIELDMTVFDGLTPEARALMNAACDYLTTMLSTQSDAGDATTIECNASVVPPTDDPPTK